LKASIPGCETLDMTSETEMTAKVVSKIGPVKATFTGKVRLENIQAPESYTISGEGQGGVAGFAKGGADVKLTEDGTDTILNYTARAQIGGKLAQLGARLIDSTAKMMADQFFAKFSSIVAADAAAGTTTGDVPMATEAATASMPAEAAIAAAPSAAPVAAPSIQTSTTSSAHASAASSAASSSPGATQWIIPLVTFVVGVVVGKFLLGH
jgi:carbon monoxide dehydrogenase subunit G